MRKYLISFAMLCCLCSVCFAGTGCEINPPSYEKQNTPCDPSQFDIKPYVNMMVEAARIRDSASAENSQTAAKAYEAMINSIKDQIKEKRKGDYNLERCIVSRMVYAWASDKSRPWGPHKYARGKVVVSQPDDNWELDKSLPFIITDKRDLHNGHVVVSEPVREGNNVVLEIVVKGPDYGHSDNYVNGVARGQYKRTASYIDQQVTMEFYYLWERVEKEVEVALSK